jgi:phosphohistidine phosphatase SixA
MTTYLNRHADAGDRDRWDGDDRLRPLSEAGRRQAEALVRTFEGTAVSRLISSPYLRCTQTLDPLAGQRGLAVQTDEALSEGMGADPTLALMGSLGDEPVALCTHGDIVEAVIERLIHDGVRLHEPFRNEKGGTWVLHGTGPVFTRATYLPAP